METNLCDVKSLFPPLRLSGLVGMMADAITVPIGFGFFGIFNCQSQVIKNNGFSYSENDGVGHGDYIFRNQFGDCINDHKEYTGLLRELPMKVHHLSMPGGFGTEKVDD